MASGQESAPVLELGFYMYAVPDSHRASRAPPSNRTGADHHRELGEFILPYEAVRSSAAPELAIMEFVDSTYAGPQRWPTGIAGPEMDPRARRGGDDRLN